MQKTLDTMIGENESTDIENNTTHIFHYSRCN